MKIFEHPAKKDWKKILERPVQDLAIIEKKVLPILEGVKKNGDKTLKQLTEKFDGVSLKDLKVHPQELAEASKLVSEELKKAINIAFENIQAFHGAQSEGVKQVETIPGVLCWRKSVGIPKVGLYIPGGSAPLFSSVLMLGIPARIAGCQEVVLCTPPDKNGKIHPAILYCAELLAIKKIYKLGGAQAIAAMAFGTESVPKVDKIFGPGNQYVTAAKQLVSKDGIAIDMPAGPSEVAVLADSSGKASYIAADLLSQAEHGPDSQVIFMTMDKKLLAEVQVQVEEQLELLPRKELARQSLENSRLILVRDVEEAVEMVNEYAPEHLILQLHNAEIITEKIKNAGSVFLGNFTPEAAGDYASGTNHTLPTNGYAKAYSGVSLDSFVKKITFQQISATGLKALGPVIEQMAEAEQLHAHKNAVSIRLKDI